MAWDYYPYEKWIKDANLKVISCVLPAKRMDKTIYLIRFGCCGDEREMSHSGIRAREKSGRERDKKKGPLPCRACQNIKNGKDMIKHHEESGKFKIKHSDRSRKTPYGIHAPAWPVPPLALQACLDGWEGR